MEGPLYVQLIVEELRLSSHDLSSTKLNLRIDSITKEYLYPFRDIFFHLSSKFSLPDLHFSISSPKTNAEGSYKLKNLKLSDKFRVTLSSNRDIVGFLLLQMNLLENLNKEICKHCALSCDIINHTSKSAKKLANLENKIIENDLGLEISLRDLEKKNSLEKEDLRYFKNLLLGAHEKIKTLELRQQIEFTNNIATSNSVNSSTLDYPKIIQTLEQKFLHRIKLLRNFILRTRITMTCMRRKSPRIRKFLGNLKG